MEKEVEKVNEEILLRERLFRSLVEHSHDIIFLLDEKEVIQYPLRMSKYFESA